MAGAKDLETCLRVLAQGSRALVEERDLDRLLATAVDVATRLTGAVCAVAAVRDRQDDTCVVATSDGFEANRELASAVIAAIAARRAGGSVRHGASDARAALGLAAGPERGPVLRVPIVEGTEVRGFVGVVANAAEDFDDTDESLLGTVASQVATTCSVIRASEDARLTETRYQTLVEQLPAATYYRELDKPGVASFISPQVETIFGIPRDVVLREPDYWRSRIHPDDRARVAAEQAEYRPSTTSAPIIAEYRWVRDDGKVLWIRNYAHTLRDEAGNAKLVMGILFDITRTKELEAREEEEQKREEERLREARTMEAIGRLAGGVAHDFNNQLSIVLSYASMIKDGLLLADPLRDEVELIERAGHRARELTRQLLAIGRRQVLRPELVDLSEVAVRVAESAKARAGKSVEVTLQFGGPCMVRVDPGEVEQAIAAVVANALEAMPSGGKLRIELREVHACEAFCRRHPALNPGTYWAIVVKDTGTGMDATTLSRAFEPFFSTKEVGRGLGLSTVFGVVHQSGGTVTAESEPGKGSEFHLYLRQAASSEPPKRISSLTPPSSDAQTVLVVEDDPQVRRLTGGILKRLGFRVLEASDGVRALHVANEYSGTIHLLVTDVVMPQMGGRELAERMRVVRPETRILFVSGYTDDVVLRDGIRNAGVAFLPKPFTADALTKMVHGVLGAPN